MEAREERRDRTWRYGARTRREHLRVVHGNGPVDCICELSAWKFAKGKAVGCHCSKRTRGAPKVGHGICYGHYGYREAVVERIRSRRLCASWRAWAPRGDLDDVTL